VIDYYILIEMPTMIQNTVFHNSYIPFSLYHITLKEQKDPKMPMIWFSKTSADG
jgi:hypothetical protein